VAAFGNRKLDVSFKANIKNRAKFLKDIGIDYRDLVCVKQLHKSNIAIVRKKDRGKGALNYRSAIYAADGLITKERNIPLAVFTADCLSIFLFCPKTKTIALVHAGWRSTKENIAKKAIILMKEKFYCKSKDIIAALGPAIRKCCYQVGKDFKKYFKKGLIKRNGKLFLDLIEINKNQLVAVGVKRKNIIDSGICTSCQNNKFFSFRREKDKAGRQMSVIMLK
jgi:YfiH family protein